MDDLKLDNDLLNVMSDLKKAKAHRLFDPFQVFAVQLSPDEIAYIHYLDDHFLVAFNIFDDAEKLIKYDYHFHNPANVNPLKRAENHFNQEYVCCILENHEPDDLDVELGMFQKYRPHKLPTDLKNSEEKNEILKVLNFLNDALKSPMINRDRLQATFPIINGRGVIPLIVKKRNTYDVEYLALNKPEILKPNYEDVIFKNDILLSKLKQLGKEGSYALEFFFNSIPVVIEENGDEAFFINGILIYDFMTGGLEPVHIPYDYESEPQEFIDYFAQEILRYGYLPEEVLIRDKKTLSILKDLFNKLSIEVKENSFIPELDKVEAELFKLEHSEALFSPEALLDLEEILSEYDDFDDSKLESFKNDIEQYENELISKDVSLGLIKDTIENDPFSEVNNLEPDEVNSYKFEAIVSDFGKFSVRSALDLPETELIKAVIQYCDFISGIPDWQIVLQNINSTYNSPLNTLDLKPGEGFKFHSNDLNLDITFKLIEKSSDIEKGIKVKKLDF